MIALILIGICGLTYLLFNELEDECVRNNWATKRKFLNGNGSWKNKWEMPLQPPTTTWYYFGIVPKYRERFFLSSTLFVWLTDGEHLFQFIKNRAIEMAFLVICWQYAAAWIVGKSVMQIIKEKFIKSIQ